MPIDIAHIKSEMDLDFIQRHFFWDNAQLATTPFFRDSFFAEGSFYKIFDFLDNMAEKQRQNPDRPIHVYDVCGD
jgi:hypothetical protein